MSENVQFEREVLTTNEAVEILGLSKQTIYNYVKNGKLKLVYEDWQIDGTMKFYRDEINRLQSVTERPAGITVLEAANHLGVSKATIHQYIKSGKLSSEKVYIKGRLTSFIPTDQVHKLQSTFQSNQIRKTYFSKDLTYCLFGLYIKKDSNEKARIIELNETGDCVAKTNMGEFLNKEELIHRGFYRAYELKQVKHSTKRGNIVFRFPLPQSINAPIFSLIDTFYQKIGIQNMNIYIEENTIIAEVKPVKLQYQTNRIEQDFEILQNCLQDGKLSSRPGLIVFSSNQEQVTTFVEDSMKMKIKQIALKHNLGIEEVTEKLIRIGLAEYEKKLDFS